MQEKEENIKNNLFNDDNNILRFKNSIQLINYEIKSMELKISFLQSCLIEKYKNFSTTNSLKIKNQSKDDFNQYDGDGVIDEIL